VIFPGFVKGGQGGVRLLAADSVEGDHKLVLVFANLKLLERWRFEGG
jgi:hypothetical protein